MPVHKQAPKSPNSSSSDHPYRSYSCSCSYPYSALARFVARNSVRSTSTIALSTSTKKISCSYPHPKPSQSLVLSRTEPVVSILVKAFSTCAAS